MKFPRRLVEIANFIEDGSYIADIGADHGLLETLLVATKPNAHIFAVENKIGPFTILSQNVKALKNVEVSLSNGISMIPDNIDTLVIAGMGGINISTIIDAHPEKLANIKTIIIDAHRNIPLVRKKFISLGYGIVKEKLVQYQGIYYNIILFNKISSKQKLSESEYKYGFNIKDDPCFRNYINHLIRQRLRIIENLTSRRKIRVIKREIKRIEKYAKN